MQLLNENMFSSCKDGDALCITTNGVVRQNGALVMGAGIAKTFRDKFEGLDTFLGTLVSKKGNQVYYLGQAKIDNKTVHLFSFPTKHHWKDDSDLNLIRQSCFQLEKAIKKNNISGNVYLPMPGCTNGHLSWENQVKPIVQMVLNSDQYKICYGDFPKAELFQGLFIAPPQLNLRQKLKEAMEKKETVTEAMVEAFSQTCFEALLLSLDSNSVVLLEDFYVNNYTLNELADMRNEASEEAHYTADDIAYLINRFEVGLEAFLRSKVMFQKMKTFAEEHDHILAQNNPPTMK